MTLIAEAERAEDIGDAIGKFKNAVEEKAAEITALVSEFYAVGSALRDIDTAVYSTDYGRTLPLVENDLDLVRSSLTFTLNDIFKILGEIGNGARQPSATSYRQTWKEIALHFQREGCGSLCLRLELYRAFLLALYNKMRRRLPENSQFGSLRDRIRGLLADQTRRTDHLADVLQGMALSPPVQINRPKSYERERPPGSPTSSRHGDLPWVPEAPSSPTDTYSTAPSSVTDSETGHWILTVFKDVSSTPLPRTGEVSRCYGESVPDAEDRLQDDWEELLEIGFGGGAGLIVRLYLREEDHRARILCKSPRKSGGYWYSCLPLNTLDIRRHESSLRLYRRNGNKGELWACFKFSTIERLVIFYCTLLSLRSHDNGKPVKDIQDHELDGEQEFFGGQIDDDNFLHALRVLRDHESKAVRLQASVLHGEMKRTPIWTAFITNYLVSPMWLRRAGPKMICVNEMRRQIFSSEYSPQLTIQGEHVIKFTTEDDAESFVRTIRDLARRYRRF